MQQVVLQTSYFPPIPWLAAALKSENPIIDIHEHYIKQTCRNRCTIVTANGLMNLVIPVEKFRNHTPVAAIRIDHETNWQRVHTHAIRSAYGKSPYFEYYGEKILRLYEWKAETLAEWNAACLSAVFSILKVNPLITFTAEYIEKAESDIRSKEFAVQHSLQPQYIQVFMDRHGFYSGLSVLDLLFCAGPDAREILQTSL